MLRWQPKNLFEQLGLPEKLFFLSAFLHLSACVLIFFVQGATDHLFLQVGSVARDAVVRLVPLTKRTGNLAQVRHARRVQASKTGKQHKKVLTKAATSLASKKQASKSKVKEKSVKTKAVQAPAQKIEPKEIAEETTAVSTMPAVPVQEASMDQQTGPVIELGREEYDAFLVQQALQEAVSQAWASPVGMATTVSTTVEISLSYADGTIEDLQMVKPSGILLYDTAVRDALYEIQFPRQIWGKRLTMTFNP